MSDDEPLSAWDLALGTHLSRSPVLSSGRYELCTITGETWRDERGRPRRVTLERGETFPVTDCERSLRWRLVTRKGAA